MQTKKPLLVLVDDDETTRHIVAAYLRYAGFAVEIAVDGEDAIAKVKALSPAAVLMDIQMPVMDGREAARRLKADKSTCAIPIIALTAASGVNDEELFAAGCDAVCGKPCEPQQLVTTVMRELSRARKLAGCVTL